MLKSQRKSPGSIRGEDGNVTIEFVILFPALLALTAVTMDVSFAYYKKSQIHAAVQDFTRARSIGVYATTGAARTALKNRLISDGFTDSSVQVSMAISKDPNLLQGLVVSTNVKVPLHDMELVGFFAGIVGDPTLNIGDQQFIEKYDLSQSNVDTTPQPVMVQGIIQPTTTTTTTSTTTTPTTIY